jgi:SAM-dependent methyltransferase
MVSACQLCFAMMGTEDLWHGKAGLLRWMENRSLQRHFHGRGIEIGAFWRRFPLPRHARVWYIDRLSGDGLEEHYPELHGNILQPDLLADATELPVAPASLDFLIASHVLEHLLFPLAALEAWYRALAPGGILLLRVPDKRYTFDKGRARTTLAHLLAEHNDSKVFGFRDHYADWVTNVGGLRPGTPEFEQTIDDLMRRNYSIHFHSWIDDDVREIVDFTRSTWRLEWNPVVFWGARSYRKETTVLLRRK